MNYHRIFGRCCGEAEHARGLARIFSAVYRNLPIVCRGGKLHCNLSEMERISTEALQAGESLTSTETAYHTAMQAYVAECRGLVNQGEYNLPPVPQLRDFDVELAAYKEHVKEEIAQEAARLRASQMLGYCGRRKDISIWHQKR